MLAYRHAFHAGNHADVLKHLVLVQVLRHMNRKEKPYWVIDTHAGAGGYPLHEASAQKNAEYAEGIERLWNRKDAPEAVQDYLAQIRAFNTGGPLLYYPGSPGIAHQLMRPQDKLRLFELHPTDHRVLDATFGAQPGVQVRCADGFVSLKSLLPPQGRRAVVLLDPSYELKTDYAALRNTVSDALQRFAVGTYAVWYPVLQRRQSHLLPQQLRRIAGQADWLDVRMQVREPDASGFGLLGSGMFLINPPWTLHATLREVLPWLTGVLGQFNGAHFALEQQAG
ncbi:23S rRNA (adenine(2030)-N(6))-methyltransferase RlmJ [Thiomonas arsenitoxydans]|jgi:23S rRNA (adenine2030-N6)-methyltransferase|uniref:23S rRNA (adenine(2030)-N(6))-methyltransferase RlmJ n=1 Tax=Thiomonas arsenitoxydans (strain DSM 22701 / CIP 110005 / 3As) TaxID=426114 RepID=UPI001ACBFE8D|nr:23S rRNA (adenine(2030)-N(6))-methyltransferase RlmJ [Thiomonas arsenitoxydans]MBN8775676.1 23S rRNA (adenine(2030)-N(6))-methyltransferase RlmJ [Thiomonas arsenitoxydans]